MERREHDIFMEMLDNPGASLETMITVGLTPTNTSLLDKSVYKQDEWVLEQFKGADGNFDEIAFNKAYDASKLYYNSLSSMTYNEAVKKQAVYHRDNILADPSLRRKGPDFNLIKISNPYQQIFGLTTLGKINNPTKSIDELALEHKVLLNPTSAGDNLENAKWDLSPNDSFTKYFFDTLVLALYDEDGEHKDPITGEIVLHSKGDLKLDDQGEFYYERLDGRNVYDRRVLNKMNVLTRDGSWANKFDPFDSDDIELKSVAGSIVKNTALLGSMFLPYVGPWITGLSIVTLLAGMGATFGKMLAGSDNTTLSEIEGWSRSLNRQTAKTDYAQQHPWCFENMIDLIGDVFGLLKEFRFMFTTAPGLLSGDVVATTALYNAKLLELQKARNIIAQNRISNLLKTPEQAKRFNKLVKEINAIEARNALAEMDAFMKGYNKLGLVLSRGYMTGITVQDTYGEAKNAGASDLDATILTLGHAAGEWAILSTGIGEWVLPELRANEGMHKAVAKAVVLLNNETQSLRQLLGQSLKNMPKDAKKEYFKKVFNIGKKIASAEYVNGTKTLKSSLAAGLGEGVEEVTEEVLADFSKACYDLANWLRGNDSRIDTFGYDFLKGEWNTEDLRDRYGLSLVGGFVGGGLTNVVTDYRMINSLNNMTPQLAILLLVYMSRNGDIPKFLKTLDKIQLADPNLSATEFEEQDGTLVFSPGTKENNQDLYAKRAVRHQVKLIQEILEANGGSISDESLLRTQTDVLEDLRYNALHSSTTAGGFINEYNTLISNLVKLVNLRNQIMQSSLDTNNDNTISDKELRNGELSEENKLIVEKLDEQIKEIKKLIDDITQGKRSYEFIADSLFEMTDVLSGIFTTTTFPLYAELYYGKKYEQITETERAEAWDKYEKWKVGEGREKIKVLSLLYRLMAEDSSKIIKGQEISYLKNSEAILNINKIVAELYKIEADENTWLERALGAELSSIINFGTSLLRVFGNEAALQEIAEIQSEINNTFDSNLSLEELNDRRIQSWQELNKVVSMRLLESLKTYVDPIIESGYANTETKELLNKLISLIDRIATFEAEEASAELGDTRAEEIDSMLSELTTLKKLVNELSETPFELNLNQFSISIGNTPINITQLLDRLNTILADNSQDITLFNIESDTSKELDNAINTIKMYKASVLGARTDAVDIEDRFGYNATLNEVAKKTEGKQPELAEIDSKTADILISDIDDNLNKLEFLRNLYYINQGLKLSLQDRVATRKNILIYKALRNIITVDDKDNPLKRWDGLLELQAILDLAVIHRQLLDDNSNVVSQDQIEDFEKEKLAIEDGVYEFFKANEDKDLTDIINPQRLGLYTKAEDLLTENLESIDGNSMLGWLVARAAVKATPFYNYYRLIIDPRAEKPLAPVPALEMAVFFNYASIINGNVFTKFYEAARRSMIADWTNKSIEDKKLILRSLDKGEELASEEWNKYALNFLPVPRYSNIVLVEGVAGSGKTQSVIRQTVELLKKFHPDLVKNVAFVHGANKQSAEDFKNGINLSNSEAYDKQEWMLKMSKKYVEPTITNEGEFEYKLSDIIITDEGEIKYKLTSDTDSNPPSVIFIDEAFKFSGYDLDLINDYADKHGITVIAAGDSDLSGAVGSHKIKLNGVNTDYNIEVERTSFLRTPKLGIIMRSDNSLKTSNIYKVREFMYNPNSKIELLTYQDETGLYGDSVSSYATDINPNDAKQTLIKTLDPTIELMVNTLKSGEKIGYIYTDESSPIYKHLKDKYGDKIDFKKGGSAQGLESQYYIIEPNSNIRDIYTGISRAKLGSILIIPRNLDISSNKVNELVRENLLEGIIRNYTNKRKTLLDNIINEGSIEYIKRTPSKGKTITPESKPDVLPDSIDSTPPTETGTVEKVTVNPETGETTSEEVPEEVKEPEETPLEERTEEVQPLPYDDNIAPIVEESFENEESYKDDLDIINSEESKPESTTEVDDTIKISMLLHSFNTFETGVVTDRDGKPILDGDSENHRIDSVNGLAWIDRLIKRNPVKTVELYIKIIGDLRSYLFNIKDKAEIAKRIEEKLGLTNVSVRFALKSSPRISEETKEMLKEKKQPYLSAKLNKYIRLAKSWLENTIFNGSEDTHSKNWHPKSLVAIINNGLDVVELPLIALSSPLTLMLTRDADGNYPFNEVLNRFNALKDSGLETHYAIVKIIEEFDGNSKYKELINLFKLFNITDGAIKYIEDESWTPFNNLELIGPLFETEKGIFQYEEGLGFDKNERPESNWQTITEFNNDPLHITTQVMTTLTGWVSDGSGNKITIAKKGHPFVLVSYDKRLNNDTDILNYYILLLSGDLPPRVKLMYILPPKATISEYLLNLLTIIFGKNKNDIKPIGLLFTSYKLMKTLLKDKRVVDILDRKVKGLSDFLQKKIDSFKDLPSEDIKELLYKTIDVSELKMPFKMVRLAGLFDNAILQLAYNINTITNPTTSIAIDEEGSKLLIDILNSNRIDGIYYNTHVSRNSSSILGSIYYVNQENYSIDGKPFRIHGKLDSYLFKGNMDWLVQSFLDNGSYSDGHWHSSDTVDYINGHTNNPVELNPEEKEKNSVIEYIKSKIGNFDTSIYDSTDIRLANSRMAQSINKNTNRLAYTIGNRIYISKEMEVLKGETYLFDDFMNPAIELNWLIDEFGDSQLFIVRTNGIDYTGEFKDNELYITPPIEDSSTLSTININESNFIEKKEKAIDAAERIFAMDLVDLFNSETFEEFNTKLATFVADDVDETVLSLEELLDLVEDKELINDMVNILRKPKDNNEACPISIKINF